MEKIEFMINRTELGSEFSLSLNDLEITQDNLFSYFRDFNIAWLDYGRSALRCVPFDYERKILLPEFICESVIRCFPEENLVFYGINSQLEIDEDDLFSKWDEEIGAVYVCHYFGYIQNLSSISKIREKANSKKCILIEDLTQSLFSTYLPQGDYMVASIRKWMAIPQGGMLFSRQETSLPDVSCFLQSNDNTKAYGMLLKDMFLNMGYDTNLKYREIFDLCEEKIGYDKNIKKLSSFAKYLISCCDVNHLIHQRRINFSKLEASLSKMGLEPIKKLSDGVVPLVYPIRINNRDEFRTYLMEHRIYCAVHWPFCNIQPEERTIAKYNAETLLSLPIDQRYGQGEMDYMINIIEQYGGELLF